MITKFSNERSTEKSSNQDKDKKKENIDNANKENNEATGENEKVFCVHTGWFSVLDGYPVKKNSKNMFYFINFTVNVHHF